MQQLSYKINALGTENKDGQPNKGTLSVYGLGRFPVTLYANQWKALLSGPVAQALIKACDEGVKAGTLAGEKQAGATTPTGRVSLGTPTTPKA